ncbi:DUF6030 family protein [Pseudomonas sp. R62]|jgi:hypothetical protein|uniref:DUF6030 family protein n=1 Tax=Pseudomonas sp. R62 TaxID=1144884 RepID=UPI0013898D26|nr:hypothetical protein [Pseudomonas sp. R62]
MIRLFLTAFAAVLSLTCVAELRITSPNEACSVLSDTRLRADSWSIQADRTEGCSSSVRAITVDSPSGNTIAFMVQGTNQVPERFSLKIDIASPNLADDAKREMIKAAKRLSVRALGLSLPHSVDNAILKGENISLQVGSGAVIITRTDGDKGDYQLALTMQ